MRRYEFFSDYDYTAIEEHLAKMAERGWLLEKTGPFCWTYRSIPPQRLRFHVSYFPHASRFDPEPTPELEEYTDLAAHTGWRRCAERESMQIFCTAERCAAPMETDPALYLGSLRAACARSVLPLGVLIMLACALMLTMRDTLPALTALFVGAGSVLCMVYYALELTVYALWLCRAARKAQAGEFAASPRHSAVLRALQWTAFGLMGAFGLASAILGAGAARLAALVPVLAAALLFSGAEHLRERLQQRGRLRNQNRACVLAYSVIAFAAVSVVSWMVR